MPTIYIFLSMVPDITAIIYDESYLEFFHYYKIDLKNHEYRNGYMYGKHR